MSSVEDLLKEQFHLLDAKIQNTQDSLKIIADDKQIQINQIKAQIESLQRKIAEVRDR